MCKTREKTGRNPNEIIRKASKGFLARGILTIVLWALFIVSVVIKICCNEGFASLLAFRIWKVDLQHWGFFAPSALLEVAKTIGVFSVLIAWIYAELGKSELGRRYTELLSDFCRHYHLRALSYILAILACIYIATIGILESAGIAMVIAAVGLWDQVRVLVGFIFNSSVRKELAIRRWKELFNVESGTKGSIASALFTNLYTLIDNISVKDECFDELCKCLAEGILVYTLDEKGYVTFTKDKIISLSNVWERLLDGRPYHEQYQILHNVLEETYRALGDVNLINEQKQIIICAGYIQRQIRYYTKIARPATDNEGDVLLCIVSDIHHIRHKLPTVNDNCLTIVDCIETLYVLLCWMHFLCNNILLGQELLVFLSNYEPIYDDSYKEYFRVFIRCTFDDGTCNNKYDIAWNQVRKT